MTFIEFGFIGIIGFLILFCAIPEYVKMLGKYFGEGLVFSINEELDQQFDIFYEKQEKKENGNG